MIDFAPPWFAYLHQLPRPPMQERGLVSRTFILVERQAGGLYRVTRVRRPKGRKEVGCQVLAVIGEGLTAQEAERIGRAALKIPEPKLHWRKRLRAKAA